MKSKYHVCVYTWFQQRIEPLPKPDLNFEFSDDHQDASMLT